MNKPHLTIYWSRRDFRTTDNPALSAALAHARESGNVFLPVFIIENYMTADNPEHQFGLPSRYMVTHLMSTFMSNFPHVLLLHGRAAETLRNLSRYYEVTIFVNDDIYPDFYTQVSRMTDTGIDVQVIPDALTVDPQTRTGSGDTYSIFTPFKRKVWDQFIHAPVLPVPDVSAVTYLQNLSPEFIALTTHRVVYSGPGEKLDKESIKKLFPTSRHVRIGTRVYDIDQVVSIRPEFNLPYDDQQSVREYFTQFLHEHMDEYADVRNDLSAHRVSYMSPALAWGLVSARMLVGWIREYYHTYAFRSPDAQTHAGPTTYISELIWREFYRYLMHHDPLLHHREFQKRFRGTIDWVPDTLAHKRFTAWITGTTGYPLVDAAMMQLAHTGYMHNRTRMVVSSILTKNLGVDWRWGQEYFRAMLIDLDECSNNGGWQWGASVGADPKPIRIFNPQLQAKNYDPEGVYQKHWLGQERYFFDTIEPIIPHADARAQALQRYGLGKDE